MDINILATCEEFISVHSLPSGRGTPFPSREGESTIQARGDTRVRLEALHEQLLKTHLHVCGGAVVSGMTGGRQQVGDPGYLGHSLLGARPFLSHGSPGGFAAPLVTEAATVSSN